MPPNLLTFSTSNSLVCNCCSFFHHKYLLECSCYSDTTNTAGSTSNAFIFSLRNKEGLGPFKSMVTNSSDAIVRYSSHGPTFGGGPDLHIANDANSNDNSLTYFGTSYSVPSGVQDLHTILAGTNPFTPDEVEVFYLG